MLRSRLGMRLSLILAAVLAVLLAGGLVWLDRIQRQNAEQQVEQSTQQSALALEASLKSIMLSGEGPIAHDWLQRVRQTTNFDDVNIFRRDGTEAFVDNNTIDRVNQWLGNRHFEHHDRAFKPTMIAHDLEPLFVKATAGKEGKIIRGDHLTLLLPIHIEGHCLTCHGYDGVPVNSVRGVLELSAPLSALTKTLDRQRRETLEWISLAVLSSGILLILLVNHEVVRPIKKLQFGAQKIRLGDENYRVTLERSDELGELAHIYNQLVDHLQQQTSQQGRLYEAMVALSSELVDDVVLRKIGELAMQLTGAHYAMLSYVKHGEKQFIPLGMDSESMRKLQHTSPQGLGLLGLLWNERQVVRTESIANHPRSIGFPEGHPPMNSFLGVPIEFAGQMIGALYLTDKDGGQSFTTEDETVVRLLGSGCAIALSNAQQFEQLQLANADLENRVTERTSELHALNHRLRSREIELELMNEELRRASEAKNQFLANTSHELRTPLNAIIGFSDLLLLQAKELPEKYRGYTEHINSSGKRLLDLINSLLDLSKIEAGMLEIHQEPAMPGTILHFMVNHLRPLLDRKKQEITIVSPDVERTVCLDAGKLQQVWVNLIGNAIKFTGEGGILRLGIH